MFGESRLSGRNALFTLITSAQHWDGLVKVEGQRIRETEIGWSYVFGGVRTDYRLPIRLFGQDRASNLFVSKSQGSVYLEGYLPRFGHSAEYIVSLQELFVGPLIRHPPGFKQINPIGMLHSP